MAVPGRSRWVPVAIAGIVGIAIGSVAVPRLFQQPADEPAGIVEQVAAAPAPDTAVIAAEEPPPPTPTPEPEERAAPVTPSPTPPRTVEPRQAAAPATERVRDTVRTAPVQQTPVAERPPATDPVAAARPVVTPAPSPPPPTVATVRGTVRDGVSGAPLGGVAVSIPGTAFAVRTDASGGFELPDVPAGQVQVRAELTGRPATTRDLSVTAGVDARLDLTIAGVPKARTPDDELAAGSWTVADLAAATDLLGMPIAVIPGLTVESIATPSDGGRPRVRVAQLTASGERIVLTETRSGAPVPSSNPRVTALRVIPASPSYPVTTGTASFGNLLVTAKAEMDGGELRELLAKLVVAGASD